MKESKLRQIIREELLKEWWTDIDGKSKKEIQDILIRNGFDSKKIKRASDDSLSLAYDIAKKKGMLKKESSQKKYDPNKGYIGVGADVIVNAGRFKNAKGKVIGVGEHGNNYTVKIGNKKAIIFPPDIKLDESLNEKNTKLRKYVNKGYMREDYMKFAADGIGSLKDIADNSGDPKIKKLYQIADRLAGDLKNALDRLVPSGWD